MKGRKYEVEVEVPVGCRDMRRALTNAVDMALSFAGARIQRGTYRVTIERIADTKDLSVTDPKPPDYHGDDKS